MPSDPTLAACTIVAHNYLPMARVLARSFLAVHPEAKFFVVVIDRPIETRTLAHECFEVVPITDLDFGDEGFELMATAYDVTEFATSVKPFALLHLLKRVEHLLYLDPDIKVYNRLDGLFQSTMTDGVSLTPHCLSAIQRDGLEPAEADIMAAGVYNLGYIGVSRAARPFLEWWSTRMRRDAIIDPANQLFTDQRWVDLAIPIFRPHIEQSSAYNVAYWNLDHRVLSKEGDRVLVDGEPLRFFHFSGYDITKPFWLSKYQQSRPRVLISEHPIVAELCAEYAEELAASHAADGTTPLAYGWGEACPGVVLRRELRRRFRSELVQSDMGRGDVPPSPFVPGGAGRFVNWLAGVAPDSPAAMSRSVHAVWEGRSDVRAAMPEVADGVIDRLSTWVRNSGVNEFSHLRLVGGTEVAVASPVTSSESAGVNLVGYLNAELGVGQAGRLTHCALTAAKIPVATMAAGRTLNRQLHTHHVTGSASHRTILTAVNADQMGALRGELGAEFFRNRYTIGQWFWETEAFPQRFRGAFQMLDEVWAATEHMCRAFSSSEPNGTTVTHMPIPLLRPKVDHRVDRACLGLPDGFLFLFSFDFFSVVERKNPIAIIDAFRLAFKQGAGPVLVIKTINGDARMAELEQLRWASRDRDDIIVIDGYFDEAALGALLALCDCYVSLHRAEGLGLTMAKAMTLAKPVIATAYSGNMDFMTDETAFLVPWSPSVVPQGAAPYDAGTVWAEPDVRAAASRMLGVVEDPVLAASVGAKAQLDLAARFSAEVCGSRMKLRLETIWSA